MDSKNVSFDRTSPDETTSSRTTSSTGTNFAEIAARRPLARSASASTATEPATSHFEKSKRVSQVKDASDSSAAIKPRAPGSRGINRAFGGFKKSSKKRGSGASTQGARTSTETSRRSLPSSEGNM